LKELQDLQGEVDHEQHEYDAHDSRYSSWLSQVIDMLIEFGYLSSGTSMDNCSSENVTMTGTIAAHINECNPIMLTELLTGNYLDEITTFKQLISVLSLFLQSKPSDRNLMWIDNVVPDVIQHYLDDISEFENYEAQQQLWYSDWSYTHEYTDIAAMWVSGMDFNSIIHNTESEIYSGEFVRMMLKLNNICRECVKIAHISQNDKILSLLDNHQSKIIRDIVVPQSLYMN
jgi:superfamily II RNA helicase